MSRESKIKDCEECGVPIRISNNKNIYCQKCAKIVLQEQKNKWKREKWRKEEK